MANYTVKRHRYLQQKDLLYIQNKQFDLIKNLDIGVIIFQANSKIFSEQMTMHLHVYSDWIDK